MSADKLEYIKDTVFELLEGKGLNAVLLHELKTRLQTQINGIDDEVIVSALNELIDSNFINYDGRLGSVRTRITKGMSFSKWKSSKQTSQGGINIQNSSGVNIARDVSNSNIQVTGQGNQQILNISVSESEKLIKFLSEIKNALPQLNLPDEKIEEAKAEISTIETQINSPRPKATIVKESFSTLRHIIEGAAGSIIGAKLLEHFPAITVLIEKTLT